MTRLIYLSWLVEVLAIIDLRFSSSEKAVKKKRLGDTIVIQTVDQILILKEDFTNVL